MTFVVSTTIFGSQPAHHGEEGDGLLIGEGGEQAGHEGWAVAVAGGVNAQQPDFILGPTHELKDEVVATTSLRNPSITVPSRRRTWNGRKTLSTAASGSSTAWINAGRSR